MHLNMEARIELLFGKDTREAYQNLLELERLSDEGDVLYGYFDQFLSMLDDERYGVRVRGFRLLAKQARWDADGKIDRNIRKILASIDDEKPTAVRMKLAALGEIVHSKEYLRKTIEKALRNYDYSKFPESTRSLIDKDISRLLGKLAGGEL